MDVTDIGPVQVLAIGFGPDAEFTGLVLDELDRLTARGLIRVIDLRFATKGEDGSLVVVELGEDSEEAAALGAVADRLLGIAGGGEGPAVGAVGGESPAAVDGADAEVGAGAGAGGMGAAGAASRERSFGLAPDDLAGVAQSLAPGESIGVLLIEHLWAAELRAAIRTTGGFPLAQGLLTPEALLMIGAEVRAVAEAEATIEIAEAVRGAAMLDAVRAVAVAEDIKTAAAVEAVRALVVADLVADTATEEALEAPVGHPW